VIATLYRPYARDRNGDPVDQDGDIVRLVGDGTAKLGTVDGIIIGSRAVSSDSAAVRGDVVSTEGLIGWPSGSALQPQSGDVLEVDGQRFAISGPRLWGRPHSLTGNPSRFSWITATAN
jgi:hypothetical protein